MILSPFIWYFDPSPEKSKHQTVPWAIQQLRRHRPSDPASRVEGEKLSHPKLDSPIKLPNLRPLMAMIVAVILALNLWSATYWYFHTSVNCD